MSDKSSVETPSFEPIWWKLPSGMDGTVWMWDGVKGWYAEKCDNYQNLHPSYFSISAMDSGYTRISDPRGPQVLLSLTDHLLS